MFFLELLRLKFETKFTTLTNATDSQWKQTVYKEIQLESQLPNQECANQCLNLEGGSCNVFVVSNLICFLGNFKNFNGSVSSNYTSNIVYVLPSKSVFILLYNTPNTIWDPCGMETN